VLVRFDYSEASGSLFCGDLDGGDGYVSCRINMLGEHPAVIHLVDVVAGKDHDVLGPLTSDGIDILVDRVGRALIPLLRNAHLRWQHFDVIAESRKRRPSAPDVAVQAEGL